MQNMFNLSKQYHCKMPSNLKIVLVTAYSIWADYFCEGCKSFRLPTIVTPLLITDGNRQQVLEQVIELEADVIVVSSPGFLGSEIGFVEALRLLDSKARVVMFCSNYTLPSLNRLEQCGVQGFVSLNTGSRLEFEQALYDVIEDKPDVLKQQYLKLRRFLNYQHNQELFSKHEKILLALVAGDFKDEEIAQHLYLSPSTVRNELRVIFSKLGVRGRGGAAGLALSKGIISPDMVLDIDNHLESYSASKLKAKRIKFC